MSENHRADSANEGLTTSDINLHTLPIDVLDLLIPYLDTGELLALSLVNRQLHHYFSSYDSLWLYILRERIGIFYHHYTRRDS